MTLNEGQSHPNWYLDGSLSRHTKFERNWPVNDRVRASVSVCLFVWEFFVCLFFFLQKPHKEGSPP